MNLPFGAFEGTTTVGSVPAVPAGDRSAAGSGEMREVGAWVVAVVVVTGVLLFALEQALSPSEATSPTAATRAVCFFMEVRVALSR